MVRVVSGRTAMNMTLLHDTGLLTLLPCQNRTGSCYAQGLVAGWVTKCRGARSRCSVADSETLMIQTTRTVSVRTMLITVTTAPPLTPPPPPVSPMTHDHTEYRQVGLPHLLRLTTPLCYSHQSCTSGGKHGMIVAVRNAPQDSHRGMCMGESGCDTWVGFVPVGFHCAQSDYSNMGAANGQQRQQPNPRPAE